jgi:hypothetical protein
LAGVPAFFNFLIACNSVVLGDSYAHVDKGASHPTRRGL